jgi:hypothetical protein
MPPLRASQVETLRLVDERERAEVVGMKPLALAAILGVVGQVASDRLKECFDAGLLYRQLRPTEYGLTQLGREALEGTDG